MLPIEEPGERGSERRVGALPEDDPGTNYKWKTACSSRKGRNVNTQNEGSPSRFQNPQASTSAYRATKSVITVGHHGHVLIRVPLEDLVHRAGETLPRLLGRLVAPHKLFRVLEEDPRGPLEVSLRAEGRPGAVVLVGWIERHAPDSCIVSPPCPFCWHSSTRIFIRNHEMLWSASPAKPARIAIHVAIPDRCIRNAAHDFDEKGRSTTFGEWPGRSFAPTIVLHYRHGYCVRERSFVHTAGRSLERPGHRAGHRRRREHGRRLDASHTRAHRRAGGAFGRVIRRG
jgi:hypothetical protein